MDEILNFLMKSNIETIIAISFLAFIVIYTIVHWTLIVPIKYIIKKIKDAKRK